MPTRGRKKKYIRPFSRMEEGVVEARAEDSVIAEAEGGTALPVPSGVASLLAVSSSLPELALAVIRVSKPFFFGSESLDAPLVTVSWGLAGAVSGLLSSGTASFSVAAAPLPASSPVEPLSFCSDSASGALALLSSFLVSIASFISTSLDSSLASTFGITSSIVVCSLACPFFPFFAFPVAPPSALRLLPVAGEALLCDALGGLELVAFCAAWRAEERVLGMIDCWGRNGINGCYG